MTNGEEESVKLKTNFSLLIFLRIIPMAQLHTLIDQSSRHSNKH
jgi:hypothetical protein